MSLESRVLRYLRENPGATPRLIADALGVPLSQVRLALNRLRDSGQVVRVPGEGYYARAAGSLQDSEDAPEVGQGGPTPRIPSEELGGLREAVDLLASRVERLEKEMREIKIVVEALAKAVQEPRARAPSEQEARADRLIRDIRARKLMRVGEALAVASKPLEEYVRAGVVRVVSDLVVDAEFYEQFLGRFPIRRLDVPKLSEEERELMNAMIKEGIVYLHGGREYRVTRG